jgi:hypothetical protein
MYCDGVDCLGYGMIAVIQLFSDVTFKMIPWWIIVIYIFGIISFILDLLDTKFENKTEIFILFLKLIFLPFICMFNFIAFIFCWNIHKS